MTTAQVLIAQPDPVDINGKVQVNIHIEAELTVSAMMARRQVTGYLIDNVSDHLGGELPVLAVNGKQLLWRVPVMLYLTSRGNVGKVGEIDVDSQTGQLLVDNALIEDLKTRAEYLAA